MKLSIYERYFLSIILIDNVLIYFYPMIKMITHPIVACGLIIYYKILTTENNRLVIIALFMSLVGGVFLLFDHPLYFKIGIILFLIVHVLYSAIFALNLGSLDMEKLLLCTSTITCALVFNYVFFPLANEIKWYILFYSCVLTIMVCLSIIQNISLKITIGALIFAASNISLGINRFVLPNIAFSFFISISYVVAQFMIIKGLTKK